jgi:hypothetical protein
MGPAEGEVVQVSQEVFALMKRYRDGYHVSTVIVTAGNAIKILGGIVAGIIAVASIIAASQSSAAVAVGGILVTIAYGLTFLSIGNASRGSGANSQGNSRYRCEYLPFVDGNSAC